MKYHLLTKRLIANNLICGPYNKGTVEAHKKLNQLIIEEMEMIKRELRLAGDITTQACTDKPMLDDILYEKIDEILNLEEEKSLEEELAEKLAKVYDDKINNCEEIHYRNICIGEAFAKIALDFAREHKEEL